MLCPCGSLMTYPLCCGRFIEEGKNPETAEELMRSRYTAFSLAKIAYISETQIGKAAEGFDPQSTLAWIQQCEWLKLDVLETKTLSKTQATVLFKAYFKENGIARCIEENSLFEYIGEKWYYSQNKSFNTHLSQAKIGRNDPCPCHSGKKYKKCCEKK